VALPHFPNKHTRSKYTKKLVWRYVPVLSPAQYWHRIEAGKIILAANEREDALKNVRRLRPRSVALLCPPELQGTWDRYHREFGDIPRSSCGQCLDEGVLRTSRSITTACNTPTVGKFEDPTLVLNRLAEQLGKKNLHPKEVRPHKRTIRRSSSVPDDEQPGECKQENDGIKFQTNNDALHTGRTRFMTGVRAKYVANHHIGRMPQRFEMISMTRGCNCGVRDAVPCPHSSGLCAICVRRRIINWTIQKILFMTGNTLRTALTHQASSFTSWFCRDCGRHACQYSTGQSAIFVGPKCSISSP